MGKGFPKGDLSPSRMGSLWGFPRAKGLLSTSSRHQERRTGAAPRDRGTKARVPPKGRGMQERGQGLGPRHSCLFPAARASERAPVRRKGGEVLGPRILGNSASTFQQQSSLVSYSLSRLKGPLTPARPPSLQVAGKSLASGGSCPGLKKDPSCLSRTTDSRGPFLRPGPRACSPAHLGSSAHCH